MKRIVLAVLAFGILTAQGQTVDEIIQKYSANLGGLDAFNKIKTAKLTGTFTTQGMDFPITIQIVNGKASRLDMNIESMNAQVINVYNNGKAWKQNPFAGAPTPTAVESGPEYNDLKVQSMFAPVLMDYKARGHKVELQGQEKVEGVNTFKIVLTAKEDGRVTNYYISTTDYTLIKSSTDREVQGQTVTLESFYSDLKTINGVKIFMARDQKMNGEVFQTTKFTSVELDVPVDNKIFEMPK
jgi:hypothetical protein